MRNLPEATNMGVAEGQASARVETDDGCAARVCRRCAPLLERGDVLFNASMELSIACQTSFFLVRA